MPRDTRGDGWGRSHQRMGPAGGKHTRSNKGQKGGCLDVVILGLLGSSGLAYTVQQVFG